MNRKNLTAAVLAGLAGAAGIVGSAQAVNINPDGLGEVLIFPYYTTNGDNLTSLSVINTSDYAKAVKVRFLEGKNSREVLDFNLYMSPYDVWTAVVYEDDGVPTMATDDNTCTVPYIYSYDNRDFGEGGKQEFLRFGMNDQEGWVETDPDTYGDISRATEGHFEVIEMGMLTDEDMGSATAITHIAGELPATVEGVGGCQQLVDAWTDPDDTKEDDEGYWLREGEGYGPQLDMDYPVGGMFGGAAVVNVGDGAMYSYDATAINGFSDEQMHNAPGSTSPNLNSGNIYLGQVFKGGDIVDYNFALEDPRRGVDAVSYVFMRDSLMNEYSTNDNIGGETEWVVTFPTKHFYVYGPNSGSDVALAPFTEMWDEVAIDACEIVVLDTIWDRNEQQPGTPPNPDGEPIPPIVSPPPPFVTPDADPRKTPFELCYETNVIAFGKDGGGILDSANLHTIDNDTALFSSIDGWARIELDEYDHDFEGDSGVVDCDRDAGDEDGDDDCISRDPLGNLEGLPVAGFAVERFINQFVGADANKVANYGGIFQHKYTRKEASDFR